MDQSKNCIFVVDDDPEVLQAIKQVLSREGMEVMSFTCGLDCLKVLRKRFCHLLITDLKMPELDGLEMIKRARMFIPGLPVLVITGFGDIRSAVKSLQFGAVDFLEKPLKRQVFLEAVEAALHDSHIPVKRLTKTELKVISLLVQGMNNRDIATDLHRSLRTIEVHRSRIIHKFGARSISDVIRWTLPKSWDFARQNN